MFNIALYLDKFKHYKVKEVLMKEAIAQALFQTLQVKIERRDITVKNNEAHLRVSGVLKSELLLKKEVVLSCVAEILKNENLRNIK